MTGRLIAALALLGANAVAQPMAPPGPPGPGMGPPPPMPKISETRYSAAIRVIDGAIDKPRSTPAAVHGGTLGDTFARGVSIASAQDDFNGVLVQGGRSAFTLADTAIDLRGTGHNDFLGVGAGAMTAGGVLVLRNVRITTSGPVASATIAAENGLMRVYDSTLIAHGGPLPADYVPHIGPGMMEPPAPLKISGTARTNITMSHSQSYFYNSTIVADGWGALSTDATGGDVYLEANDCTIRVIRSGYGVYSDFGARVVVNRGSMDAATYGGVVAGAAEVRFNQVAGKSGGNVIMIHSVMGDPQEIGHFQLQGGTFASRDAAVLIKSANADVVIDGARVDSASGMLVQSVVNDDANATRANGAKTPGNLITLRNGAYSGNVVHGDTERGMAVSLEDATLNGAIRNAVLSMNAGSHWMAAGNSQVELRGFESSAHIDAPVGVLIQARAGQGTTLVGTRTLASGGTLSIAGP